MSSRYISRRRLVRVQIFLLIALCTVFHGTTLASPPSQDEGVLEVTPKEFTLDDRDEGEIVTITSAIANFDFNKLDVSKSNLVTVEKISGGQTLRVKPIERGLTVIESQETIKLVYDSTGQKLNAELKIRIKPRAIEAPTMVIAGATPATDKIIKDKVRLVQGQTVPIRLRYKDAGGNYAYIDKLSLTTDPSNIVSEVAKVDSPPSLKADNPSDQEVKIAVRLTDSNEAEPTRPGLNFAVQVGGAIESLQIKEGSQIAITEGESRTLGVTILGPGGAAHAASKLADIRVSSDNPAAVNVSREDDGRITLNAVSAKAAAGRPVRIAFSTILPTGETKQINETVDVSVVGKSGYLEFRPPPREFLLPNSSLSTTVVVRNREGTEQTNAGVEFKLANADDAKWVTLAPEGRTLTIFWNDPPDGDTSQRPSQVKVKVTAFPHDMQPVLSEFSVRLRVVKGFTPLTVRLDVMNARMAHDLYGKQMADEFHVLVVRLFNNLKDDRTGQYVGDSILAYSSSIEVAVGMEKKFRENRDSQFQQILTKQEAVAADAADAAKIKAKKDDAITRDQARLDTLVTERKTAEDDVQRARLALVDAHRKATGSKLKYIRTKVEADKAVANQDIAAYNAAVRTWEGAKETLRFVETQISGLRTGILNNAASIYDVSEAYRQYGDPNTAVDDGKWRPINRSDLEHIAAQDATENPSFFTDQAPEFMSEMTDKDVNALAAVPAANGQQRPADETLPNRPQCLGTATYRPFTFEMMVNTVDRRDGRSFRTGLFKTLDSLGTAASLVTAVAVPGPSSDFPLGLDKYRNLLIPNAERLFPNFKEQHRQNIVSQAMKLIEEIPFGSDITRVIFVPKKEIQGMLRGHDVRISEVCTFYFKVDVAIIQKAGAVQAGTAPR